MEAFQYSSLSIVYTLKLENDCFYVGYSENLNRRLFQHFNGEGSKWCKLHKPIELVNAQLGGKAEESIETLRLMGIHGKDKVRGGGYTNIDIKTVKKLKECIGHIN